MTIEAAGLVNQREDSIGQVNRAIRKRRCRRRLRRHVQTVPIALQRLFLACRDVFKGHGTVPSPDDVQRLCHILDDMMPEDVGLSRNLDFFNPRCVVEGNPRVTYTTIYQSENFSLCIFFLPATAVIPLHNHPGMTVFSKLLKGTMHVKAYDWVDPSNSKDATARKVNLVRMKANRSFTAPCNTSVLYPTSGGNLHEFRAITPCAVLDVLGPPYSADDGRDCSYYRYIPYDSLSNGEVIEPKTDGDCYGWLEEIEPPEESEMDVIIYRGPQVVETSF